MRSYCTAILHYWRMAIAAAPRENHTLCQNLNWQVILIGSIRNSHISIGKRINTQLCSFLWIYRTIACSKSVVLITFWIIEQMPEWWYLGWSAPMLGHIFKQLRIDSGIPDGLFHLEIILAGCIYMGISSSMFIWQAPQPTSTHLGTKVGNLRHGICGNQFP